MISDLHLIAPFIKTDDDWNSLLQTIFRTPSLDVYLKISHNEDINSIVEYWGNLNNVKKVKPILEKARNNPNGEMVNIADLLPDLSRKLLNTFPSADQTSKNSMDCIWTVFNFYNNEPDNRIVNGNTISDYFLSVFSGITDKSQMKFGDFVLLTDNSGNSIHGFVNIAGNICYSKNGKNSDESITPFVLYYYDKILSLYNIHQKVTENFFSRIVANTHNIKTISSK